jgi:hypothetical protein
MVHRGYYRVTGDATSGFDLEYSSADFEAFEARDILLSELASGFLFTPPRGDLAEGFDRFAATAPVLDHGLSIELRRELIFLFGVGCLREPSLARVPRILVGPRLAALSRGVAPPHLCQVRLEGSPSSQTF